MSEIDQKLKSLINEIDKLTGDIPQSNSAMDFKGMTATLTELPESLSHVYSGLIETCNQIEKDKIQLSNELMASYTQLNVTFDATLIVARCKTVRQAVDALANELSRALDSQICYYFWNGASDIASLGTSDHDMPGSVEDFSVRVFDPNVQNLAEAFLHHNREALLTLTDQAEDANVRMVDYQGEHDDDHHGRGNVLTLRIQSSHTSANVPILLFVRRDTQEPFAAVEMNLAATLGRMCSAVMGNIVYAQELQNSYLQTITSLVRAMEAKDAYTSGHSNRVAEYACRLGRKLRLDEKQIQLLEWAGLLHDIGKIGIRDDVLCKPGKLTHEEFEHIKSHPIKSFNVIEPIDALCAIKYIVKHHHEHYDGSGYPDGLAGEEIPKLARILQIADVWDALTSTRSYRKKMSYEKARSIMIKEAGSTMDPAIIPVFLEIMDTENIVSYPEIPETNR
ncbi:MAG: HD-GYP domain-containing protein [Phycisphaerae bacterium]|nr:HD-GYP domain-containing protein [Phycisphaerae bacterium]